jgi:hypothetical protein
MLLIRTLVHAPKGRDPLKLSPLTAVVFFPAPELGLLRIPTSMHAAAGAGVPVTYISVDSSRSERSDASCRENSLEHLYTLPKAGTR